MKVGSIVECISELSLMDLHKLASTVDVVKGGIYTVNWVGWDIQGLWRIGFRETHPDQCYDPADFREIEFPPSLEAEIKESLEVVLV